MSQLNLQPFRRFTYVTGHSTTLPLLHLRHRHFTYFTWQASFSNPYIASPTSLLILQPFRCFTYVTAHSTTLPFFTYVIGTSLTSQLILQHFAGLPTSQLILDRCFTYAIGTSPMSQLILQPFCCFIYATAHSKTILLLHLHHRHFTWRAAHA